MRRGSCLVIALVALAAGSAAGRPPRLVVTPSAPVVGAKTTIELHVNAKPPVYVTVRPPGGAPIRLKLRRAGRTLWRATFTFEMPGAWVLRAKSVSAFVMVAPPLASTFTPPGVPGCTPPSPANALTRDARGTATTGDLWALFGDLAAPRQAVLAGAVGKVTKIVWRMSGTGEATFTSVAPNGSRAPPKDLVPHAGSNWNRPGDEWGSIFVFSQPGCWQIHAERAGNAGDLWLLVRS